MRVHVLTKKGVREQDRIHTEDVRVHVLKKCPRSLILNVVDLEHKKRASARDEQTTHKSLRMLDMQQTDGDMKDTRHVSVKSLQGMLYMRCMSFDHGSKTGDAANGSTV